MKHIAFLAGVLMMISSMQAADIYISPRGSDQAQGSQANPLASLSAARDKVRSLAGKEAVTVHVADGVYYLPETLVFTPADSGSAKCPVVYKAENEGGAVLSGGSKLELQWKPYKDGIFQASTPAGLEIDQLFINGKNQRMARYPNYDPGKKAQPYQGYAADAFSKTRAAGWADPTGGYIHAMHRASWGGYHYRITGKKADGEVSYEGGWQNNRQMGMHKDFRMVENIFEELDAEGEWFHDAKTSSIYYKPQAGADLSKATVEVVRLRHLVEFQGSEKAPVKFITLKGFAVRHAARTFMDCKEQLLRSDWAIYRGGAIMLTGTEDVSILDTEFDQVGGNAIFINNYNRRTLVKGCHIHDAGASGVCFVGDPDAVRNPLFEYGEKNDLASIDRTPGPKTKNFPSLGTVEDCLIHGIGRVERQPAGVMMDMASEITVRDCSVYDCARSGINIGDGCWGGHLIERCDVFDTVLETHDHGSFNSWGRDRYWRSDHLKASQQAVDAEPNLPFLDAMKTTVIRNSRWRCEHGWDIDLDDGSSNYDIYNNLLLCGGLKLREGYRRRAWNNITVNNGFHPHVWFNNSGDEVYSNIFSGAARGARMPSDIAKGKRVDSNFFYDTPESQVKKFVKYGWDVNSIAGDPMFVDPENGDFRVKDGSPAFKIGFRNFPMDQFGVKKSALKAIAQTPSFGPKKSTPVPAPKPVTRPVISTWLGADLHSLEGEEFSAFGTRKEDGGIALTEVPQTSDAARAGLQLNDLIQGINGQAVSDIGQFFKVLSGAQEATLKLRVVRNQQAMELSVERSSVVEVETASAASGFSKLPVPVASGRMVTANQKTGNDPLKILTDGQLGKGYGPVFGNGIHNGVYKMDLGGVKSVAAVTSWSYNMGRTRGAQKLMVYGSSSTSDPGWDLNKFTALGMIDTTGAAKAGYTAASLRAVAGKSLGSFRWIFWSVSPVSELGGGENTAFQELAVAVVGEETQAVKSEVVATPAKFPGRKTDFHGFDCYEFRTKAGVGVKVVCPEKAAPGKPWLWRSLFWEAIPLFYNADLQLVKEGYHVVLVHGDVSGHPSGNKNIDAAYELLTTEYGFSKKCSMASMSRGTLSLFRWATQNPEKVESIYVDNGVCNVLSWPAGKIVPGNNSTGNGDPGSWADFKRKFGYASDAEALLTKESPINLLEPLAKAGVPILMVCGSKDTAVPYEENDAIMEERYKKLGGSIQVIIEDKGHSHGMKDPTPVLEFIKKHSGSGFAEQEKEINPYAVSANAVTLAEPATLKIAPDGITMLSPNLGTLSAGIKPVVKNYMILWCAAKAGPSQVEWTVEAPADGVYGVMASIEDQGSLMTVSCNGQQCKAEVTESGWHRIELGEIPLKAGQNKVLLEIDAITVKAGKRNKEFLLSALELAQPSVRKSMLKEAVEMRQQPEWFKDAGYGLMFQWTNRATPPKGPIKDWEEKVNDFNLDGFVNLVEDSGAAYVVWSMTWGNQYISAPIKSLDAIIAGRTTSRDLLGEMVERLHEKGVRVIFYYHYGYECYHSQDTDWLEAAGGYEADKTKLYANVMSIISEVGTRYGDKLDGWWFDGGARYLNCHFDGSSAAEGILSAPLKAFTAAARAGNPERIIAYNSWIKPRITEYQDYYGGEGRTSFKSDELEDGVFKSGCQQGLQAHGCFILERRWGHIDLDMPIAKPKFNVKQLTGFMTKAKQCRYPLSINLEMYEDGSVSPESYALLKELKAAFRGE